MPIKVLKIKYSTITIPSHYSMVMAILNQNENQNLNHRMIGLWLKNENEYENENLSQRLKKENLEKRSLVIADILKAVK